MMRVELLKAVMIKGEPKRSGVFEVPDETAKHWIATGAAKAALPTQPAAKPYTMPADTGKKGS